MQSTAVFLLYRYSGNGNRADPIPNPGSVTDGDRCILGGPLYFVAWFMPQPARLKSREPPGDKTPKNRQAAHLACPHR